LSGGGGATGEGDGSHGEEAADHGVHLSAYVIFAVFLQLTLGLFFKLCAVKTGVPYTLIITVAGWLIGYWWKDLGVVGLGIREWSSMGAHDILLIFLPALVFESAFNADWHIMKTQIW